MSHTVSDEILRLCRMTHHMALSDDETVPQRHHLCHRTHDDDPVATDDTAAHRNLVYGSTRSGFRWLKQKRPCCRCRSSWWCAAHAKGRRRITKPTDSTNNTPEQNHNKPHRQRKEHNKNKQRAARCSSLAQKHHTLPVRDMT